MAQKQELAAQHSAALLRFACGQPFLFQPCKFYPAGQVVVAFVFISHYVLLLKNCFTGMRITIFPIRVAIGVAEDEENVRTHPNPGQHLSSFM